MALPGIIDDAVFAMTGFERRIGYDGELVGRNPTVRRLGNGLIGPDPVAQQSRPEICRRARDDAVVVLRETLGFHQRFPAAVRAAGEIGVGGRLRVIGFDNRFGRRRRLMDRPPPEIRDLFGMAEGPARLQISSVMAGVCRRHRVAPLPAPDPSRRRGRIRRNRRCRRPRICRSRPPEAAARPRRRCPSRGLVWSSLLRGRRERSTRPTSGHPLL